MNKIMSNLHLLIIEATLIFKLCSNFYRISICNLNAVVLLKMALIDKILSGGLKLVQFIILNEKQNEKFTRFIFSWTMCGSAEQDNQLIVCDLNRDYGSRRVFFLFWYLQMLQDAKTSFRIRIREMHIHHWVILGSHVEGNYDNPNFFIFILQWKYYYYFGKKEDVNENRTFKCNSSNKYNV